MRWAGVAGALVLLACEGDASLANRPCPCVAGYVCCELTNLCVDRASACKFALTPSEARLRLGARRLFEAPLPVTWSVDEPGGGSIDQSGQYQAPLRPGVFHVRARTSTGASASANVIVGPSELKHLIGVRGGTGNADGVGRDARFTNPVSIVGDDQYLYVSDGRDTWYNSNYEPTYSPEVPQDPGCVKQCATAADPDACAKEHLEPWLSVLHPVGVRRIARATGVVEWLFRDTVVGALALDGGWLFASKTKTAFTFELGDDMDKSDYCRFGPVYDSPPSVVRIDPETGSISTVAGNDSPGPAQDGIGAAARFGGISGMVARAGKLYVTDRSAIREIDTATGKVTTLAAKPGWEGATLASAEFGDLIDIAVDDGKLYALDYDHADLGDGTWRYTLWQYDLKSGGIEKIEYILQGFQYPRSLCFDSGEWEPKLRVVLVAGNCIHTDLKDSKCDYGSADFEFGADDGTYGRFARPEGIWCAGNGTYYVADTGNATIRELSSNFEVRTVAGEVAHQGPETAVPPGPYMRLWHPFAVTSNSAGNVVIGEEFLIDAHLVLVGADAGVATYDLPYGGMMPRSVLGPNGVLYVPTQSGLVFQLDLEKAFQQQLEPLVAGSWLTGTSANASIGNVLAHDGIRTLYTTWSVPWGVTRIDTVTGTVEPFVDGSFLGPLAIDGDKQLFAGHGPLFRIDIATRQATALPTPSDGWEATALAYDPAGVLFVAEASRRRVRGLVIDTGEVFDVVGSLDSKGVRLGALPASLSNPADITLMPDGSIVIADYDENVVVVAQ